MKILSLNEIDAVNGGAKTYEEKMVQVRTDAKNSGIAAAVILGSYGGPLGAVIGLFSGACFGASLSMILTD